MESKYQKIIEALKISDHKKALNIARKFFFGLSKAEYMTITRAYESNWTNPKFYEAIGTDKAKELKSAIAILDRKYLQPYLKNQATQKSL